MADWYPSDSDEDNSFLSSSASSEESGNEDNQGPALNPSWMINSGDSSDDDDTRVIKSAKAKRWEELRKLTKNIQNKKNINDWTGILGEWIEMIKCVDKARTVIREHGLPSFFIACMLQLEDFINEIGGKKDLLKNMKKQNAQSFNTMKQRFKKYLDGSEFDIKAKMTEWRETEKDYEADDFEDEDETSKKNALFSSDSEDSTEMTAETTSNLEEDKEEKWTQEKVEKKVKEMLTKRGTKAYNKKQHLKDFSFLREKAEGLNNQLVIDFHILDVLIDSIPASSCISLRLWVKIYNMLADLLDHLTALPADGQTPLKLYELREELQADGFDIEQSIVPPHVVTGHFLYPIERLGDEFTKALQATEAPSEQYLVWLSYENYLLRLLTYAKQYYMDRNDYKRATVIAQKILYFVAYRHETEEKGQPEPKDASHNIELVSEVLDEDDEVALIEMEEMEPVIRPPAHINDLWSVQELVPQLCSFICQHHSDDRQKRWSILELVYHYAIHDRFFEARDLLLMTHLQEKIHKAKPALQVLFNRAMVQLGLAAFRLGRIRDAHNCLQEISSGGKVKELLAQGINQRFQGEKSKEQEKSEHRRQVPYHKHINLELIECVHLTCAMLLEVPTMAQSRHRDNKKKIISKMFHKVMDYYDRQIFTGPPENTRETVLVAAKALEEGDWKRCKELITSLPILQLIPNNQSILNMLGREIQEQSLRTYLFTYGQYYDSLSTEQLVSMFDLEENVVHSIISKMIISEELSASWDQPTGALIIHSRDPSDLQFHALNYSEKINILLESTDGSEQRGYERRWNDQRGGGQQQSQQQQQQQQQSQQMQMSGKKPTTTTGPSQQRRFQSKPSSTAVTSTADKGFSTRDRRGKKMVTSFKKK